MKLAFLSDRGDSIPSASREETTRDLAELTEMGALERRGERKYARYFVKLG